MNSRDVVIGYALGYGDGYDKGKDEQKNDDFNNGFPVEVENGDGSTISTDWGKFLELGERTSSKYMTVCDEKYAYYASEITYERINPVSSRYDSYVDIMQVNLETGEVTTKLSHQKIGEGVGTGHTSLYETYVSGTAGTTYKYLSWVFVRNATNTSTGEVYKAYKTISVRTMSTYKVIGSHDLPSYKGAE